MAVTLQPMVMFSAFEPPRSPAIPLLADVLGGQDRSVLGDPRTFTLSGTLAF